MTDIFDQASDEADKFREYAIAAARRPIKGVVHGRCNNCGESCVGAFCDKSCEEDFEVQQRMAKINGRV
jgi:hypothetical protein